MKKGQYILVGSKDKSRVKDRRRRMGEHTPETLELKRSKQRVKTHTQIIAERIIEDNRKLTLTLNNNQ